MGLWEATAQPESGPSHGQVQLGQAWDPHTPGQLGLELTFFLCAIFPALLGGLTIHLPQGEQGAIVHLLFRCGGAKPCVSNLWGNRSWLGRSADGVCSPRLPCLDQVQGCRSLSTALGSLPI